MKSRTEILVPIAAIQAVPIAVIAWYRLHRYAWYRYSAIVKQSGQFGQLIGKTLFYTLPLQRSNTDSKYLFLDDVGENGRSGGESPNRHGEPKTRKIDYEHQ